MPKDVVERQSVTRCRPVHCQDLKGNITAFPSVKSAA